MSVYFIASDIHGSAYWCRKMLEKFLESGAERMILLGDILYHGPRNDLPRDYAPKEVIDMLNPYRQQIWAVRGNCEAEVDQMVLDFPVMADYAVLALNGHTIYATHGHVFNEKKLPPLMDGDALLHGHTHLLKAEWLEAGTADGAAAKGTGSAPDGSGNGRFRFCHLNPGSVSIPKGGNPNTYAVLRDDVFTVYDFEDQVVASVRI